MASVKVTVGTTTVEVESAEYPVSDLTKLALDALDKAQRLEQQANDRRDHKVGQYA